MEGQIGAPLITQSLTPVQLKMILLVIVLFVVMEPGLSVGIGVLPHRIERSVLLQLLGGDPVPSLIGNLVPSKEQRLYKGVFVLINPLQEIGVQFRSRPVHIPIGSDPGQPSRKFKMIVQDTGAELHIVPQRVETPHG